MDNFFDSIKVREKPELAGLPVVVSADPKRGKGRRVAKPYNSLIHFSKLT